MSNDPRYPDDDDSDDGNKRTRLVMRPDLTEGGASATGSAPNVVPRGGAVIGTTRLVGTIGGQSPAPPASGYVPGTPTMKMHPPGKTQYVREGTVDTEPVAGWIVVVKGPGRGGFRPVFVGMNSIGRAPSQRICLDFGDESISREEHAFITYDDESRTFYLQHGGKSNLVRLDDKPVLQPTELKPGNQLRIGNTTFRFFACCGPDFNWSDEVKDAGHGSWQAQPEPRPVRGPIKKTPSRSGRPEPKPPRSAARDCSQLSPTEWGDTPVARSRAIWPARPSWRRSRHRMSRLASALGRLSTPETPPSLPALPRTAACAAWAAR